MDKPKTLKDDVIEKWSQRFSDAESNQTQLFTAYQRWYDAFYAVFKENIAPWRSKVLDPKIASKAMAVIAKIVLFDPQPNLHPRSKYDFLKAKNNEELLNYQLDNPDFETPLFQSKFSVVSDMVVCGVGLALLPWKTMDKKTFKRVMKAGKIDYANDKEVTEKIGFNDFIPWSIFRAYCTPGAKSWQSAHWKILTDFKTDDEIESFCKEMGLKFDKSKINEAASSYPNSFEDSRNRLLNQNTRKGRKELWICYDEIDKEYTYILNKKVNLGSQKNIAWHQKFPLVPFYLRPRAFNPWGDGLFERSERLGAAGNSLINHFLDQLDLSMNGLVLRNSNTLVKADMTPGGEIVYDGVDKPEPWSVQQPDAQGFQLARQVINESIEENTISQYEMGIPNSNTDKTQGTKGGIEAIQQAAGDLVSLFKKSYAESCKQWFSMWMINNMQFLDRKVAVRVLGVNGYFPKEITPEDIVASGILDVDVDVDAMQSRSKDMERQFKLAYADKILSLIPASVQMGQPLQVNFHQLAQMLGEAMAVSNSDQIVEPTPLTGDSPQVENELILQGKELEPTQNEDHKTHLFYHQELADDEGVDKTIKDDFLAPHMALHEQFLKQIMSQIDDAARIAAKTTAGGANAVSLNPQTGLPPVQPGVQGSMASPMGGAIPPGPPIGGGMPPGGLQGGVPALRGANQQPRPLQGSPVR